MSTKKKKINGALNPRSLPKNIQWMHDFDYVKKLSSSEKEWLDKFVREYYDGNVKKGDRKALHKNQKLRQDCYSRKNAQNRDMQSIMDSRGKMDRLTVDDETIERPLGNWNKNRK